MQGEGSEMLEKVSENGWLRELVIVVAGPRQWTDTRESWLARAARRAGISYRQVKSIWYGEIADRDHRSVRLLRDAAEQNARGEASELANKLETIARGMRASDPDFYREDMSALVDVARGLRNRFGTRNDEIEE